MNFAAPKNHFRIDVTPEEIVATFQPFVMNVVAQDDPQWKESYREMRRRYLLARLKRNTLGAILPMLRRRQSSIEDNYSKSWARTSLDKQMSTRCSPTPIVWGERRYFACSHGIQRLYLLFLMRIFRDLCPKSVLEVGFGTGQNLYVLAARHPEIAFSGIELTEGGFNFAREQCSQDILPNIVRTFSPEPIVDMAAHKRLDLHRGSAAKIDYPDHRFDLVFTIQALEQMDAIRDAALSEIVRVSKHYIVMIEPFRDWNRNGLRRDYMVAFDYFDAWVSDLYKHGVDVLCAWSDFPNKARNGIGVVVAEKRAAP